MIVNPIPDILDPSLKLLPGMDSPKARMMLLAIGLQESRFEHRRQIGGLLGFTPTPYNSGASVREQGISGAGNARLQSLTIELAWNWIRWQPDSALTQWYRAHFGPGKRARKILLDAARAVRAVFLEAGEAATRRSSELR